MLWGDRPIAERRLCLFTCLVKTPNNHDVMNDFSKGNGLRREPLFGDAQWIADRLRWIKGHGRRRVARGMAAKMQAQG